MQYVQSCCFANLNLLLFCCSCSVAVVIQQTWLKLPNVFTLWILCVRLRPFRGAHSFIWPNQVCAIQQGMIFGGLVLTNRISVVKENNQLRIWNNMNQGLLTYNMGLQPNQENHEHQKYSWNVIVLQEKKASWAWDTRLQARTLINFVVLSG